MSNTGGLNKREQFFYEHASYGVDVGETKEAARQRTAIELAAAELWALEQNLHFMWCADDEEPDAMQCIVYDGDEIVGSLCGIYSPTYDYRRVVQAELAQERQYWLVHPDRIFEQRD